MLKVKDIVARVAAKCDDPDQTYATPEYVMGFVADTLDWLYGEMRLGNTQFDEQVVVLPNVEAGTPNLDALMESGQPLDGLVLPTIMRWKLPGQSPLYWRRADGPLDYPRDLDPGGPYLDSWAWARYSVQLAKFSANLDLELTGDFMFNALTDPDSKLQISTLANRVFSCQLAAEVGKARGNANWVTNYSADADRALDNLMIAMSKENQNKIHRLGRMNRRASGAGNTTTTR